MKNHKSGKVTYSHQMLAGCIVHPLMKQVIPIAPEPIQNSDGHNKNDCERNASKRLFEKFRIDHPKLPVIVVEDGLSSNAPHIRELQNHNMNFILGIRPGDHKSLFDWINTHDEIKNSTSTQYDGSKVISRTTQNIRYINDVPLNDSNQNLKVNFFELTEFKEKKVDKYILNKQTGETIVKSEWVAEGKATTFSWITNGHVVTDAFKRHHGDRTIFGFKKLYKENPESAKKIIDPIIKNTYRTLMTRGMKGCYVYCTDHQTREYIKKAISKNEKY